MLPERPKAFHRPTKPAVPGPEGRSWFSIQAKASPDVEAKAAEVYIYDEIGVWGVTAADFVAALKGLGDVEAIDLHLNSPGGDVFDGIAIMNALFAHPAPVRVTVDGLAASAASFLAMAGDEVVMAPHSELMIHDAWGLVLGHAGDLRKAADQLDRTSDSIAAIYAGKAGEDVSFWRKAMRAETWYAADEAVAAGLADRVLPKPGDSTGESAEDAKARFDLSVFAHAGRSDAPAPVLPRAALLDSPATEPEITTPPKEGPPTMSDTLTSGLRERLGITDADLDDAALLAALDEALSERADTESTHTINLATVLPEGVITVEETVLNALREQAAQGVAAREHQLTEQRASLVDAAISDGRVPPARREHWLASLKADPGMTDALASLSPGLVPLAPQGHTGGVDESSDEDDVYVKAWGSASTQKGA